MLVANRHLLIISKRSSGASTLIFEPDHSLQDESKVHIEDSVLKKGYCFGSKLSRELERETELGRVAPAKVDSTIMKM